MARTGHLPGWLYRALPYLYFGTGLLAMLGLRNAIGIFSGLMLMSAGTIVWTLRMRYRRYRRDQKLRQALRASTSERKTPAGSEQLTWNNDYECGHPLIDAQHRVLFESGNALLNAISAGQTRLDVVLMLDDLIAQVEKHFRDEEALLARAQEPVGREHQEIHRQLLARAKSLGARYHDGGVPNGDLFTFIARDLVAQHIIKEDLRDLARLA